MMTNLGAIILGSFLLLLFGFVVFDYFRTRCRAKGIIAGDTSHEVELKDKYFYALNGFTIGEKLGNIKDFHLIGYLKGSSLTPFGLPEGAKIFCERVLPEDIKGLDILVLEFPDGPNKGKPKGRICLGHWGQPDQPDKDLEQIEEHYGSVKEFFTTVAPKC